MTLATGSEDWTGLNVDDVDVKENTVDTGETGNGDFVDPAEFIGSESLTNLFEEKEDEIEVAPDTGAPVTEPPKKFGIKEKAFETLVEDEEEEKLEEQEEDEEIKQIVKSYSAGNLPRPRFVMLGQQGVGKSSIANTLLGFDNLKEVGKKRKDRMELPFAVGHGLKSKTRMTSFSTGQWLGKPFSPNVTVVDTPGFKDQRDTEFVEELMNVLGDEVKEVESFVIVYKYKDRFTSPFARTLRVITKMFGNFWSNVVILVNFWSFNPLHVQDRWDRRVSQKKYGRELTSIFESKFDLPDGSLPIVFIDSHYNRSVPEEVEAFDRESSKLWRVSLNKRPFVCLSRGEMQSKIRDEKKDMAEERRKCRAIAKENKQFKEAVDNQQRMIESQAFVMTNLRNGIDYLKATCKNAGEVQMNGCQWAEWAPWSKCSKTCGGGIKERTREKLPGVGTCDGDATARAVCAEQEVCPLEDDESTLMMVLGGETTRENLENVHSTSIEIIGKKGLCRLSGVPDLPEARGKMCAAYDPSGAIIVCGGGPRFWRPSNNCWQLVKGYTGTWSEIPQMYPVHGAATTFYRGKFWVLGGSTGDDSYDHTITDKVQAYNPQEQTWSVEVSLTSPRHKSCAVTIDDEIVITGGTMLGLGRVKPVWLAEIGTRTAESYDGKTQTWRSLPSLSRAKVEHGCSVATISGSRGVVVVGGATGDDVVEFLDWDIKKTWRTLGKLNRGRGMMPGVGFIGGNLTIIGGYGWPGAVDLIETWDENREEWVKTSEKLEYSRYNHASVTVPGEMFPQCN